MTKTFLLKMGLLFTCFFTLASNTFSQKLSTQEYKNILYKHLQENYYECFKELYPSNLYITITKKNYTLVPNRSGYGNATEVHTIKGYYEYKYSGQKRRYSDFIAIIETLGSIVQRISFKRDHFDECIKLYGEKARLEMMRQEEERKRQQEEQRYQYEQNRYKEDPTIPRGKIDNRVTRDNAGNTALERTIIRWYFDSSPKGAQVYWRVISSVPEEVKNTNETYIGTTPYEETRSFNILGLTYENSRDVQIEITIRKTGFLDQKKRFNVRQAIDQQEISSFFNLVPTTDY
ncbi:MAG: hypothetical protein J5965_21295 [Aeriscardovia sp.]|nr:hypothetical protein [Aeriscardovia sp.]